MVQLQIFMFIKELVIVDYLRHYWVLRRIFGPKRTECDGRMEEVAQ
jgi:hypothetical protein